ncbi:MAG: helix-turn-helix domain-containing protein [Mycobacteriales bacterium]
MSPEQSARIGAFLRSHRQALGYSTRELARRSGVEQSVLVRLENGTTHSPRTDRLAALARALDIPLADVLAVGDYLAADELPTPRPYLRTKYPGLPDEAVEQVDRYIARLVKRHGAQLGGPQHGEDERAP